MIQTGLLNPHVLSLVARVRHTNTLVIADRGFPFWPQIETVDLSLCDDIPTVLQVIEALRGNFQIGAAWMAHEFDSANGETVRQKYDLALRGITTTRESHLDFKRRVPHAIGLIRTGDTTPYGNIILESA